MNTAVQTGLIPDNINDAIRLAELMATAKLVPAALQKSPADCLMVIQQAVRWQMDPFAVAQECSSIQGRLMHSGKLVAAVVNARGSLTKRLSYEYSGEGDERTVTVSGQLLGEAEPRVISVVLKNAKTQNQQWQKQPDQQLMYHGARVWARRHTPELLLGVYSPEEFDEQTRLPRPHLDRPKAQIIDNEIIDHETGEVTKAAAPVDSILDKIADCKNLDDLRTYGGEINDITPNLSVAEIDLIRDHYRARQSVLSALGGNNAGNYMQAAK